MWGGSFCQCKAIHVTNIVFRFWPIRTCPLWSLPSGSAGHLHSDLSFFPSCSSSRTVMPLLCFRLLFTTAWETTHSHSSPALASKTLHSERVLEMFPALACFRLCNILLCYCLPCFYKFLPFLRSHTVDLPKPVFPPFFPVYLHKVQIGLSSRSHYKAPCQTVT